MTSTISPDHATAGARGMRRRAALERRLAAYGLPGCGTREIVERPGAHGSRLVVDRDARTRGDQRLVAHLAADEPSANARLACARYLGSVPARPPRCRLLTAEDLVSAPFAAHDHNPALGVGRPAPLTVRATGNSYRIEPVASRMRIRELRWCRIAPDRATVSLRDVVAEAEDYQPACARTEQALRACADQAVSTTTLAVELARVQRSAIVLNRRLREAVLSMLARGELSMSEIAMRCGRTKRDARGRVSGETSWLARRLGLLAEGGQPAPTPWIHSDVLGLIARRGLGISPREVEL
jgi:hypothetical protein